MKAQPGERGSASSARDHESPGVPGFPAGPLLVEAGGAARRSRTEARQGLHSLRRTFASVLMDLPLRALCELGGWKAANTVLSCCQQPDEPQLRQALRSLPKPQTQACIQSTKTDGRESRQRTP